MKAVYFLILSVSLTGCASELHKRNAQNYTLMGAQAQAKGDWDAARRAYARAVVNAEQAKLPPTTRAVLTYEYGRSLGATCFFDLSESELKLAHDLDKEAGNPLYLTLTELARLTFDQQKFQASIDYFERALIELDRAEAKEKAPVAYADVLSEYSAALSETGRENDAASIVKRAAEIKSANPQGQSITNRTPYGKFCTPKK
ncbi:hypothetical protein [Thauera sp.]|uniref:hypothetical protein n=1 Tax=Thauera sp. TaxID=1905334 RepID=UPI0039E34A69